MLARRLWMVALSMVAVWLCGACGGAGTRTGSLDASRLDPTRLYPMRDGYVWSYNVDTGTGVDTFAVSRVVSVQGDRAAITNGGEEILYRLREDGIFQEQTGTYLLRAPIAVGATWESAAGRAEVTSLTESVDVPAGHFEGCVEVVEHGADAGRRIRTVYCAGLGPTIVESVTQMELSGQALVVRGELLGLVRGDEDAEEPEGYDAP